MHSSGGEDTSRETDLGFGCTIGTVSKLSSINKRHSRSPQVQYQPHSHTGRSSKREQRQRTNESSMSRICTRSHRYTMGSRPTGLFQQYCITQEGKPMGPIRYYWDLESVFPDVAAPERTSTFQRTNPRQNLSNQKTQSWNTKTMGYWHTRTTRCRQKTFPKYNKGTTTQKTSQLQATMAEQSTVSTTSKTQDEWDSVQLNRRFRTLEWASLAKKKPHLHIRTYILQMHQGSTKPYFHSRPQQGWCS